MLSTDIVQTSVTLPDVSIIIDSCLIKKEKPFQISGIKELRERQIDCIIIKQRKGRTGRTCNGIYISLVSKELWDYE